MVMQLKDSETNLEQILIERKPDNIEVPAEDTEETTQPTVSVIEISEVTNDSQSNNNDASLVNNNLKKVTNIENEQINKHNEHKNQDDTATVNDLVETPQTTETSDDSIVIPKESSEEEHVKKDDQLNQILRKNILSCVEKVAQIEQLKKAKDTLKTDEQVLIVMCAPCAL